MYFPRLLYVSLGSRVDRAPVLRQTTVTARMRVSPYDGHASVGNTRTRPFQRERKDRHGCS